MRSTGNSMIQDRTTVLMIDKHPQLLSEHLLSCLVVSTQEQPHRRSIILVCKQKFHFGQSEPVGAVISTSSIAELSCVNPLDLNTASIHLNCGQANRRPQGTFEGLLPAK